MKLFIVLFLRFHVISDRWEQLLKKVSDFLSASNEDWLQRWNDWLLWVPFMSVGRPFPSVDPALYIANDRGKTWKIGGILCFQLRGGSEMPSFSTSLDRCEKDPQLSARLHVKFETCQLVTLSRYPFFLRKFGNFCVQLPFHEVFQVTDASRN